MIALKATLAMLVLSGLLFGLPTIQKTAKPGVQSESWLGWGGPMRDFNVNARGSLTSGLQKDQNVYGTDRLAKATRALSEKVGDFTQCTGHRPVSETRGNQKKSLLLWRHRRGRRFGNIAILRR